MTTQRGFVLSVFLTILMGSNAWAVGSEAPGKAPIVSPDGVWWVGSAHTKSDPAQAGHPEAYGLFWADQDLLRKVLAAAPHESKRRAVPALLSLPLPEGGFGLFEVVESPIMSPAMAARYPGIRTYRGRGVDDPTATARLDVTDKGFHAYVITDSGTFLVDPYSKSGSQVYMSYRKRDAGGQSFVCHTGSLAEELKAIFGVKASPTNPSGDMLTTYRLAVTATGEYTTYFGGTANAMAAIVTTFNRVNGIYEREVSIRLDLVDTVIYTDPTTDPFPTGGSVNGDLLTQHQADIDVTVGSANYDIGHIVSQGGGGGLVTGLACTGGKARGGTSLNDPQGDVFDVDYVSHEIGHQFSASHTWNGTEGSCSPGQFVADSAYEPGSGSTIMAYAGICGSQDVQPNSDPYFHSRSFDQITAYRDGGGACGVATPTGNTIPFIDAGADYTIPQDTPFTLDVVDASDGDGDPVQVNWEQYDLGTQDGAPDSTFTNGPLFRSVPPSDDFSRTIPPFADILADNPTPFEVLPTVDRTLNFRATVRDNQEGGGGVDYDAMVVDVAGDPFFIIAPDTDDVLECGDASSIEWNVGGGSVASDVRALVSDDGGVSFVELLASTPNDGSEPITVPTTLTGEGRVMLEAINNIFFNVSGQYAIEDSLDPTVTAPDDIEGLECTSPDGAEADLGLATAMDLCDADPAITNDAMSPFPVGTTAITWTATDASGNFGTDTQNVTVVDTTPPTITAPEDIIAECTSPDGTEVDLGEPTVEDACDIDPDVMNDAPDLFDLGDTLVNWTATDDAGNSASDDQLVTVQDTTAPELTLTATPDSLWPPNHRMVNVEIGIEVLEACDANPVIRLVSIESDEPDNGNGDGNTEDDIQGAEFGTDDREFQLRAERAGGGDGRTYTITYEGEDASGNVGTQTITVVVVHDQGQG